MQAVRSGITAATKRAASPIPAIAGTSSVPPRRRTFLDSPFG